MKPHELAEQMLAAEQAKKAEVRRLSAEKIQQRRLKRAQVQANRAKNDIDQLRALVEKQEKDETDQALAAAATYTAEQRRKQLRKLKQQKEAEAQHKAAASRQEAEARKQVRLEASQRRKDKAAQAAEAKRPGRAGKGNPQRKARRPAAAQTGQAVAGVASAREQLPPSSAVMAQIVEVDRIAEEVVAVYSNNATEARMQTVAAEQAAREAALNSAAEEQQFRAAKQRQLNRNYRRRQRKSVGENSMRESIQKEVSAQRAAERVERAQTSFAALKQNIDRRLGEREEFFWTSDSYRRDLGDLTAAGVERRPAPVEREPWKPSGPILKKATATDTPIRVAANPANGAGRRRRTAGGAERNRSGLVDESEYTLIFTVAERGASVGNLFIRLNGARGSSRTVLCSPGDELPEQGGGSISFTFSMPWVGTLQSVAVGHHLDERVHNETTKLLISSLVVRHHPTNAMDRLPCNRWLDHLAREMLLHVSGTSEEVPGSGAAGGLNRPTSLMDGAAELPQHRLFLEVRAVGPTESVLSIQVELASTDRHGVCTRVTATIDLRVPPVMTAVQASGGFHAPVALLLGDGALQIAIRDVSGVTNAGQVAVYVEAAVVRSETGARRSTRIDCHRWLSMDGFEAVQQVQRLAAGRNLNDAANATAGAELAPGPAPVCENVYTISLATADQSAARACRHPLRLVPPTVLFSLVDENMQKTVVSLPVAFKPAMLERFVIRLDQPLGRLHSLEINIEDGDPFDAVHDKAKRHGSKGGCLPFKWTLLSANVVDMQSSYCWHSACESTLQCQPRKQNASGGACRALVQPTSVGLAAAVTTTVLLARGEPDHAGHRLLVRIQQDAEVCSAVARPIAQTTDGRRRLMTETAWLPMNTTTLPEVGICCLPGSAEICVDQLIIVVNHVSMYFAVGDRIPADGQTVVYVRPVEAPPFPSVAVPRGMAAAPKAESVYSLTLYFEETALYHSISCSVGYWKLEENSDAFGVGWTEPFTIAAHSSYYAKREKYAFEVNLGEWQDSTAELWGIRLEVAGDVWTVAAAELVDIGSQLRYSCSLVGAGQKREDKPPGLRGSAPAVISRQVPFGNKTALDQPFISTRPELSPWAQWQEHEAQKLERAAAKQLLEKQQTSSLMMANKMGVIKKKAASAAERKRLKVEQEAEDARLAAIEAAEAARRQDADNAQRMALAIAEEEAEAERERAAEKLALEREAALKKQMEGAQESMLQQQLAQDGHSANMRKGIGEVMGMGFKEHVAIQALEMCAGDPEQAIGMITSGYFGSMAEVNE